MPRLRNRITEDAARQRPVIFARIGDQLDRNTEAASELVRQIDRYALRLAGLWILLREDRVAKVDGGANAAIGSQVMQYILAIDFHGGVLNHGSARVRVA